MFSPSTLARVLYPWIGIGFCSVALADPHADRPQSLSPLPSGGPVQVQATWNGGSGNWTDANWTFEPAGAFGNPNNTASHLFNVAIDGGQDGIGSVVSVNSARTILGLALDAGDELGINNGQRLSLLGELANDGVLRVNAGGSNTYLQPVGTISFSGSGAVELGGSNAWLYDLSNPNGAADHLIQAAGHSIRGVGNIGWQNNLQISNHGLIDANTSGGTLTVAPNSAGMLNSGSLRASQGGNLAMNGLSLASAVIQNSGGLIEADADSTVTYINSAHIVGGQLVGAGTHVIGSGIFKRFEDLQNLSTVSVANGQRLSLYGELVNDGLIRIDSAGSSTYLQPVGTVTLSGSGLLRLGGANSWLYDINNPNGAPDHLIQSAGHSIRGVGNIGWQNNLELSNHGLIEADIDGGTLTLIPNDAGMLNTGSLRAVNGGTLSVNGTSLGGAVIDNSLGTIEAAAGSTLSYINGARIVGGELIGAGRHLIGSGTQKRFENLSLQSEASIANGQRLDLVGTITNHGLIRLDSVGSTTSLRPDGTVTLAGNGSVELNGSNAWLWGTSTLGFLIQEAGHTIRGAGNLGWQNTLQITNRGLIHADRSGGTLAITPSNQLRNTGTLRASDGGILNIVTSSGSFASLISNLLLEGRYEVIGDSTMRLGAAVNNNAATILLDGADARLLSTGTTDALAGFATNQGSFTIQGGRDFASAANFTNTGLLRIGAGSRFSVSATHALLSSGTLTGSGSIAGEVFSSGTISPGDEVGTLSIEGNLAIDAGSRYVWQVDGEETDLLQLVDAELSFAGGSVTIDVQFVGTPPAGKTDAVLIDVSGGSIVLAGTPEFTVNLPQGWISDGVEITATQVLLRNLADDTIFRSDFDS